MRGRVPTPRPRLIKSQDHPRVCGEEHHPTPSSAAPRGSPPRMRGRAGCGQDAIHTQGITPAYAGKRVCSSELAIARWDHPRVCGEELIPPLLGFGLMGSPPRMRGRAPFRISLYRVPGITPAYAGKRKGYGTSTSRSRDHPRVCGEERGCSGRCKRPVGSPPRMRGRALFWLRRFALSRITPAYAGKRNWSIFDTFTSKDHPRVCGEEHAVLVMLPGGKGSPPRMRGRAVLYAFIINCIGDHPRVCGEEYAERRGCRASLGSPPRMRGRGAHKPVRLLDGGITPAYAGKSCFFFYVAAIHGDHPRVCGEEHAGTGSL